MKISCDEFSTFLGPKGDGNDNGSMVVRWMPPKEGFVKVNVDGSYNQATNIMGTCGLIRTTNGEWIAEFSSFEGPGNACLAELIAVRNGLGFAWKEGYKKVMCETDSLDTVTTIQNESVQPWHVGTLILATIRELLRREWIVEVPHTFREVNFYADFLAKEGGNLGQSWRVWKDPPPLMGFIVLRDALGTIYLR